MPMKITHSDGNELPMHRGVASVRIEGVGDTTGILCEGVYERHELSLVIDGCRVVVAIFPGERNEFTHQELDRHAKLIGRLRHHACDLLMAQVGKIKELCARYGIATDQITDGEIRNDLNISRINLDSDGSYSMSSYLPRLSETYVMDAYFSSDDQLTRICFDG